MKFFAHLKDAVYSPTFYHDRRNAPVGQAFGYFFKLVLTASILVTIIWTLIGLPKLQKYTSPEFVSQVASYFPAELKITLKGGQVSTNVDEPYAIPFPKEARDAFVKNSQYTGLENVVVIDTTHPFVFENFDNYKTFVLLTKDFFVSRDKNERISVTPLKSFPDGVLDRALVIDLINKAVPYIKSLAPLIIPLALVGSFVSYTIGYLFLLLISSLIIWIVYKIQKKGITYGTCYKLGLYAVTLSAFIDLILSATPLESSPWYVVIILILIVLFANVRDGQPAHA